MKLSNYIPPKYFYGFDQITIVKGFGGTNITISKEEIQDYSGDLCWAYAKFDCIDWSSIYVIKCDDEDNPSVLILEPKKPIMVKELVCDFTTFNDNLFEEYLKVTDFTLPSMKELLRILTEERALTVWFDSEVYIPKDQSYDYTNFYCIPRRKVIKADRDKLLENTSIFSDITFRFVEIAGSLPMVKITPTRRNSKELIQFLKSMEDYVIIEEEE